MAPRHLLGQSLSNLMVGVSEVRKMLRLQRGAILEEVKSNMSLLVGATVQCTRYD